MSLFASQLSRLDRTPLLTVVSSLVSRVRVSHIALLLLGAFTHRSSVRIVMASERGCVHDTK